MTAAIAESWLRGLAAGRAPGMPLVVGVQGVQGSGKSRLCADLERAFGDDVRVAVLSLDDFYLPRTQLGGAVRGPPGTHDVQLLAETISRLREGKSACLPVFDKGCMQGMGDRVGWRTVHGPVDIILVEGWCVGFLPGEAPCDEFASADAALARMATAVYAHFDAMIVLQSDPESAFAWRESAEARTRTRARGMRSTQVRAFVAHYMPYYERYLRGFQRDVTRWPRVVVHLVSDASRPRVHRIEYTRPTCTPRSPPGGSRTA